MRKRDPKIKKDQIDKEPIKIIRQTEDELNKLATERGTGLPEGMEVWTEEDLQDMAQKRQGGLDIPEWEPDKDLKECVKCGYALRPGWSMPSLRNPCRR